LITALRCARSPENREKFEKNLEKILEEAQEKFRRSGGLLRGRGLFNGQRRALA
jgi:nicotinamide riboside kinase